MHSEFEKHIHINKDALPGKQICKVNINCLGGTYLNVVVLVHFRELLLEYTTVVGVRVEILDVSLVRIVLPKLAIVILIHTRQLHGHPEVLMTVPRLPHRQFVLLILEDFPCHFRVSMKVLMVACLEVFFIAWYFGGSLTLLFLDAVLNHSDWADEQAPLGLCMQSFRVPAVQKGLIDCGGDLAGVVSWVDTFINV